MFVAIPLVLIAVLLHPTHLISAESAPKNEKLPSASGKDGDFTLDVRVLEMVAGGPVTLEVMCITWL